MPGCCSPFGTICELNGHGLIPICRPPSDEPGLMPSCCSPSGPNWLSSVDTARSSHGIVIEEGGRLQAAAVEFAVRGQPGPMSAARPADFEVFRVPRGGIRFLQALWGNIPGLEISLKVHILEWKAVVQEAIEGGFKFGFILDYLRRLARDIFSRRVLAELERGRGPCCCFEGCL
uniref:Uncharacterized protein n=1 Tax=Fagus sylvatica TaxID=28930 RepID=A0A2N9H7T9_FAGSY